MKTTIELPDALAARAREVARAQGATLRELVVDGLRSEVERRTTRAPRIDFTFVTVDGEGLQAGVDPATLLDYAYDLPR
jgi:hypothetical protein